PLLLLHVPPRPTLFPYTTLFRSPRRDFLRKSLTLIPVVTVASTALGSSVLLAAPEAAPANLGKTPVSSAAYEPVFFTAQEWAFLDRKSTRLNSSHQLISYAVFCL